MHTDCGRILLGLGSFIYFNIMHHKHVTTVIYKRSGTVLYLCTVKYYFSSFCFLNFKRDVFIIEYNNFCLQMSVWNRKTSVLLICCAKSINIYVRNPCLNVSEERMGGSSRAVVDYLLHPSFISGSCTWYRIQFSFEPKLKRKIFSYTTCHCSLINLQSSIKDCCLCEASSLS
jgi:hypothetical protein